MLRYAWTFGQNYVSPLYRDYVRVYTPVGSTLQAQNGWQPRGSSQAFGYQVWAGFFTLVYGQTNTIMLTWSVPHAATHDAHGWHYQEMIQKQAGTAWTMHIQIVLPPGAKQQNMSGGMKMGSKQVVTLDQTMTENTILAVDYTE
jgi:hypothetical protein